jgi:hypothetical protein
LRVNGLNDVLNDAAICQEMLTETLARNVFHEIFLSSSDRPRHVVKSVGAVFNCDIPHTRGRAHLATIG